MDTKNKSNRRTDTIPLRCHTHIAARIFAGFLAMLLFVSGIPAYAAGDGTGTYEATGRNPAKGWYNLDKDTYYEVSLYCSSILGHDGCNEQYMSWQMYGNENIAKQVGRTVTVGNRQNDKVSLDVVNSSIPAWESAYGETILDAFAAIGTDTIYEWVTDNDATENNLRNSALAAVGTFYIIVDGQQIEVKLDDISNFDDAINWWIRVELVCVCRGIGENATSDEWNAFTLKMIQAQQGREINFLSNTCNQNYSYAWLKSDGTPYSWTYYYNTSMDTSTYSYYDTGGIAGNALQDLVFRKMPNALYLEYDLCGDEAGPTTTDADGNTVRDYVRTFWNQADLQYAGIGWSLPEIGNEIAYNIYYDSTYNGVSGTGTMSLDSATRNTSYTIKNNGFTAPVGYEFDCWIDNNGNTYSAGQSITVTDSIILHAKWRQLTPSTLILHDNTPAGKTYTISDLYASDEEIELPDDDTAGFEYPGYTFDGEWTEQADGSGECYDPYNPDGSNNFVVNANNTTYHLWAQWTANPSHTITVTDRFQELLLYIL